MYEQGDQVGGNWVYNNPTPGQPPRDAREMSVNDDNTMKTEYLIHSSVHKNLR